MEKLFVPYLRLSTTSDRQRLTFEYQFDHISNHISSIGGRILKTFREEVSVKGLDKYRATFQEAVLYAKAHRATLIVYDIDRLSRAGFDGIGFMESL